MEKLKTYWKEIIPMVLTIVMIILSYGVYQLNESVTKSAADIHSGEQLLILNNARDFLTEYITNYLRYLAFEHNKILTNQPNSISTRGIQEEPSIEKYRRYYIDTSLLHKYDECTPLIGPIGMADEQDTIDHFFSADPKLPNLEKGIFNAVPTSNYLKLQRLIVEFNRDFNKYAAMNRDAEEFEVNIILKRKEKTTIEWKNIFIYNKYKLVQSLIKIKEQGDILFKFSPDLKIEPLKFMAEINVSTKFIQDTKNKIDKSLDVHIINPIKEATLFLDGLNYKYDYYVYFTKHVENSFIEDRHDFEEKVKAGIIHTGQMNYYSLTND